ncbi:MlaA family lipoprotein [Noviherbaspirillum massiliense]|uniref:MlaA family lipoprotein n=1 Tax=Noviherbaspirillum massiliense TaxID=1465823 RepID=UPI0002F90F9B|nr:VacJ family lipoprotein [Noviherbaspirillum massiliense]
MNQAGRILALSTLLALTGCATTNPKDPLEPYNRAMFQFNDKVDQAAVKPAAKLYTKLPSFVQTGVYNFFGNLSDVGTAVNNLLQGKLADGMSDVMRVAVNSTLGFGGLLDIGSEAGLAKHNEDFGQTLGKWGVKSGPYLVLPLLGPSTVRDASALPLDFAADPWSYKDPARWRAAGTGLHLIDQRAGLLNASSLLEDAALDRYAFVRDAYLQRRESKVRDGETPRTSYEDDMGPTAGFDNEPETESDASAAAEGKSSFSAEEPAGKPVVTMEHADANATHPGTAPEKASQNIESAKATPLPASSSSSSAQ